MHQVNHSPINPKLFEELLIHSQMFVSRLLGQWALDSAGKAKQAESEALDKRRKTNQGPFEFLSYSRKDQLTARQIVDGLRANDIEVWFDEESIIGGEVFLQSIAEGLKRSTGIIALCSTFFSNSEWCLREILFATNMRKPIRPVYIAEPALNDAMLLLLGPIQGVQVVGLEPTNAAIEIKRAFFDRT